MVDTVAGGAGVPVTAVGLLASGNWYPGGTNDTRSIKNAKINSDMNTIMIEQTTFLAGECGNTLNKPSGSTARGSFPCLVIKVLSLDTKSKEEKIY